MHLRTCRLLLLALGVAGCRHGDASPQRPPTTAVASAKPSATKSPAESVAVARVRARFAAHFAGGQGFGIDTLRARQTWFTPCLYSLMLADMAGDSARGGVGYLNWDPFTASQDDASAFHVDDAERAHDSVLVLVRVEYPGAANRPTSMVVATTQVGGEWRIANIVTPAVNLAAGLDSSLRADSAAANRPYAGCSRP